MIISAINNYSKNSFNFCAHPDFNRLAKRYEITASSYFRRGQFYGSPDKEFADIINILKNFFSDKTKNPVKMLIAGIGRSQEPFSYLAVIKKCIQRLQLDKVLDLNIVDLQSKPSKKELFTNSYYEYPDQPLFAATSFVQDIRPGFNNRPIYYRVCDEIFKYLNSTYKNQHKSRWETRVQDAVKEYAFENFDIISVNNTLGYIASQTERIDTVQHIYRILKKDGVYITDPHSENIKDAGLSDKFEKLYSGIFRKK